MDRLLGSDGEMEAEMTSMAAVRQCGGPCRSPMRKEASSPQIKVKTLCSQTHCVLRHSVCSDPLCVQTCFVLGPTVCSDPLCAWSE